MSSVRSFFSQEQVRAIEQAIERTERNTSGEIRVHVEKKCHGGVMTCAVRAFRKLKMHKTQLRNGVIIYLAIDNREFAIYGDEGINKLVPSNFWEETKDKIQARFTEGMFAEGICEGVASAGEQLKRFFPQNGGGKNELTNELSVGEE